MKPIRIQRKRTKSWKMPLNTVYVGRPSKWGNPYKIGSGYGSYWATTPRQAVISFRKFINARWLKKMIKDELKNKNLACWCPLDQKCHADILLKIANE